jgi:NADPH2:quinone reductase
VHAAGVNRADLLQRLGRYPAPSGVPADIPGLEYAGVVEAVGDQVDGWHPGDRVMGLVGGGAYAEFLTTPAEQALPIPRDWSFAEAASVPEAFITAYDALVLQGGLSAGRRVLIHAVGSSVGTAALQLANGAGATVAGTSRSPWKLERAAAYGLDRPVHVSGAFDPAAELAGWADLILDLVGGPYLAGNLRAIAPRGRILVVGLTGGREGRLDMSALLGNRVTISGTVLRSRSNEEKAVLTRAFRVALMPAFDAGRLRPVLDRTFAATEAAAAHEYLDANKSFGSVVLVLE